MKFTIQILITRQSEVAFLKDTISSVSHLGDVIVGTTGDWCDGYRFKDGNRAKIRNILADSNETDWQLYLNAGETLSGEIETDDKDGYYANVISGNIFTKEIRIWNKNKLRFVNPIHEKIIYKDASILKDMFIVNNNFIYNSDIEMIKRWKRDDLRSEEPLYYEAFYYLKIGKYDNFIRLANNYLFCNNKNKMSVVMIKFYLSNVYCYIKKDITSSLQHILEILAIKPLMSEFWCLLGDIHILINENKKAKQFYENAIILGSRRLADDLFPMDISKYGEYPEMRLKELD